MKLTNLKALLWVLLTISSLLKAAAQDSHNLMQESNELAKSFFVKDSLFNTPFIDVDEWRDKPVKHRYVHGGFRGTETRFSFYFPLKEQYQGRFFHFLFLLIFPFHLEAFL